MGPLAKLRRLIRSLIIEDVKTRIDSTIVTLEEDDEDEERRDSRNVKRRRCMG